MRPLSCPIDCDMDLYEGSLLCPIDLDMGPLKDMIKRTKALTSLSSLGCEKVTA